MTPEERQLLLTVAMALETVARSIGYDITAGVVREAREAVKDTSNAEEWRDWPVD